ncbi:unnamed protein product [Brassica oleracea]
MKDAFCLIHPSLIITCPLNALGVEVISKVIGSIVVSFCLDLPCAEKLPPLTIPNPKGHHHSLLFLPRELLVPCDVCGAVDALEPSYTCFQCNMAHQRCINLPRVIKITRHPHRLHYIPYRSPLSSLCRICYKDVDVNPLTLSYGESNNMYWCEVCEKQLDQRVWFYTCDECCVTVHLGCMFGSSYSMKPGSVYQQVGGDMKVVRNSGSTIRLFCHECNQRCTGSIYYEGYWWKSKYSYNDCSSEAIVFCSLECNEPGTWPEAYKVLMTA